MIEFTNLIIESSVFLFPYPKAINDAKIALETAKLGMQKADEAMDFFHKVLDQTVPWHTFSDALFEMDKFRHDYSTDTAALILEIKRLLLDVMDKYFKATRSIHGWCNVASHLLTTYVNLFDDINHEKSAAQKAILIEILSTGIDKMLKVQDGLDIISSNFVEASIKFAALLSRFDNEFDERSEWYRSKMRQIQENIKEGASAIGPFDISNGTDSRKLSAELNGKLEAAKKFYSHLKIQVNKAFIDIEEAKIKLNDEMRIFRNLKAQIDETKPFEKVVDEGLRDSIINLAAKLRAKCNEYRKKHD